MDIMVNSTSLRESFLSIGEGTRGPRGARAPPPTFLANTNLYYGGHQFIGVRTGLSSAYSSNHTIEFHTGPHGFMYNLQNNFITHNTQYYQSTYSNGVGMKKSLLIVTQRNS